MFARLLPGETGRLAGIAASVRQELGDYGFAAGLEDDDSTLTVTPQGQVILTGHHYDCATSALALKAGLEAAGYQDVQIAAGRAADGIHEVFAVVRVGMEEIPVTTVPGRAPVDDPALRVDRVLTPDEVAQIEAFRARGAVIGGRAGKVYPMAVAADGRELLFAGVSVADDDRTVTVRFQSRALAGAVGEITGQLEVVLGGGRRGELPAEVAPLAERLLTQIANKLDPTPRPFLVPIVPVANTGSLITNVANFTRIPVGVPASDAPAPGRSGLPGARDRATLPAEVEPLRQAAEALTALRRLPAAEVPSATTVPLFTGPMAAWAPAVAAAQVPVAVLVDRAATASTLLALFLEAGLPAGRYAIVALDEHSSETAARAALAERLAASVHGPVRFAPVPLTDDAGVVEQFLRVRGIRLPAGALAGMTAAVKRVRDYLGGQV